MQEIHEELQRAREAERRATWWAMLTLFAVVFGCGAIIAIYRTQLADLDAAVAVKLREFTAVSRERGLWAQERDEVFQMIAEKTTDRITGAEVRKLFRQVVERNGLEPPDGIDDGD